MTSRSLNNLEPVCNTSGNTAPSATCCAAQSSGNTAPSAVCSAAQSSSSSDITVIGVAGGTGSGKSTITQKLAQQFGNDVTVIKQDSYYRAHHNMPYNERCKLNYDHPDSFENELLIAQLKELQSGHAIECPVYDFAIHDRVEQTVTIYPTRTIIIEGILIFCEADLRDLMDIKVFVDCDADVRILRRILRDVDERGRSLDSVIEQYLNTVKPMHEAFVEPSKKFADIIVPVGGQNQVALQMLINQIKSYMNT